MPLEPEYMKYRIFENESMDLNLRGVYELWAREEKSGYIQISKEASFRNSTEIKLLQKNEERHTKKSCGYFFSE